MGGCWSEAFQSVAHLEEGTMPGKVSAAIIVLWNLVFQCGIQCAIPC